MRKLLNVLYITTEDAYASLDGENVVVKRKDTVIGRFPLHILEGIYIFSYAGASPYLMAKCAEYHIDLVFCSPNGRFLARTSGRTQGNVLLRRGEVAHSPVFVQMFWRGTFHSVNRIPNLYDILHILPSDREMLRHMKKYICLPECAVGIAQLQYLSVSPQHFLHQATHMRLLW